MLVTARQSIIFPQWIAGIAGLLLMLQLGLMGGWPSPTLPHLTREDSPIPISEEQASWVVSLIYVGRFFGAIAGSFAMNYFGSKRAIFISGLPISTGWLAIALANRVEILYFSRFTSGIGMGMVFNSLPIYIGEISMPKYRGALMSLTAVGGPSGQLIASVASSWLDLTMSSLIYFTCALLLMCIFLWLPESPHHLVKVQDRASVEKSISWYRSGVGVKEELQAVEEFVSSSGNISFVNRLREFKKPALRGVVMQIICLFTLQQFCGSNCILSYMETITVKAKFTLFDPSLVFIFANVSCIFSVILTMFLSDRCGRKFLLVLSSALLTLSCLGLIIYFLFLDMNINMEQYQWVPVFSMIMYAFSYSLGLFPVPNTLLSEIFPANIKFIASCIAAVTAALMSFLSVKSYQPMVDQLGETYVFLIYAILTVLVIPYTIFVVSETKGKSLQQIQDAMTKS